MKNLKFMLLIILIAAVATPLCVQGWSGPPPFMMPTAHFKLYYSLKRKAFTKSMSTTIESSFSRICASLGVKPFGQNSIYICDNSLQFNEHRPSVGESWVVGFAIPAQRKIVLKSPSLARVSRKQFIKTLKHELSHLVLHHAVGKNWRLLPRWFDEGMAMINAGQWEWVDSFALVRMVLFSDPIPFEKLRDSFPMESGEARLAYAQSYSFCQFLQRTLQRRRFISLVDGMRRGIPLEAQLSRAVGRPFEQIVKAWYGRVRDKYGVYPVLTSAAFFWFAVSLLFILAYLRKRRATRERLDQMQAEEEFTEQIIEGKYH